MFDLTGKTALVTGAGQNVGAGIARALAGQGAEVVVNDYYLQRAEETVASITNAGGSAVASAFDVTDYPAVEAAVAEVGAIDILVNNAGSFGIGEMHIGPFIDLTPEQWESTIQVNLYGVMGCCKAVVKGMVERGWGRVITISSVAGTGGLDLGLSPYAAGKGGGLAFTRTLGLEVGRSGVTANTLALGYMSWADPALNEPFAAIIPVGRTGTPEDVGAACVWLASHEASWVTGQTIQLNGGVRTT